MRDLDHDFYLTDEDRVAFAQMPNESRWQLDTCPTCKGPCESRTVGLRSVAETGDETMAGTERRSVGGRIHLTDEQRDELADLVLAYGHARGMSVLPDAPPDSSKLVDESFRAVLRVLYPRGEAARSPRT